MKKGILTVLVMLLMLAALVTIGSVAADGDEGAPFEIAAKSISTKENLVLNFKVSVPEGADLSTLSLLLWESVPEDGFTAESETAVSLALAGRESESGYYVFCYDGIEDKELGREVYVRACYRDGEETVYTETVRYSVAIYLYTMQQTAEGEFLSLLDSLIVQGNEARDAALAAGDGDVGPALSGMATVTLTDAHFADGSSSGRFLIGQKITAYADEASTRVVSSWINGSTTIPDSASDHLTFTVSENANYRPTFYTEGLQFSVRSDGTASVTDYTGSSTVVVIPERYEGNPVTSIGYAAFRDCTDLTNITIPESVTNIYGSAFHNCTGLTSITIPESITRVEAMVFEGCTSLTNITLSENVTSICSYAFSNCSSLEYFTIPNSVESIGDHAFSECKRLRSITIPENVTSIGPSAFWRCTSLASITFSESSQLTSIDHYTFYDCPSLTSIKIPSSVTIIGYSAFEHCSNLASIELTSGLTCIRDFAFSNCTALTSIMISSSVTNIGEWAFSGCSSLESVTFGENSRLTSIGSYAFYGCKSLSSITFADPSTWYRTTSSSFTNGTETDVSDQATNAAYFKSTYCDYYWYKE